MTMNKTWGYGNNDHIDGVIDGVSPRMVTLFLTRASMGSVLAW